MAIIKKQESKFRGDVLDRDPMWGVQSDIDELKQEVEILRQNLISVSADMSLLQQQAIGKDKEVDFLKEAFNSPTGADGIIAETGAHGAVTFRLLRPQYKKPFDLVQVGTTAVAVADNGAKSGGIWLAGVKITSVSDGSKMTWDGTDRWDTDELSAENFIYLEIDRSDSTATIEMDTTLPSPTDTMEPWPLWRIVWYSSGSKINTQEIIDLRDSIHITAFA